MTPEEEPNPDSFMAKAYAQRAEELASVLSGLLSAWGGLPEADRINMVRSVYRNLIDLTYETESA